MKNAHLSIRFSDNQFSPQMREAMWNIYTDYYAYRREEFMARISKNNLYALYWKGDQLIGFTGMRINRFQHAGKKRLLFYFGQTIVKQGYRGKSLLQTTGLKLMMRYWKDIFFGKAYFWCDALTYKPYLVFAKTLGEYYPSHKQATPADLQGLLIKLGQHHYGTDYCPETGTVFKPAKLVADPTTQIAETDLRDPDIRFYAQANPKYIDGHGLLTLGPITVRNTWKIVSRYLTRSLGLKTLHLNIVRPTFSRIW